MRVGTRVARIPTCDAAPLSSASSPQLLALVPLADAASLAATLGKAGRRMRASAADDVAWLSLLLSSVVRVVAAAWRVTPGSGPADQLATLTGAIVAAWTEVWACRYEGVR
jgi:hypothetical protein